jgi:hypothetical protein
MMRWLAVIEAQEFPHLLLAGHVQADGRLIQEEHPRAVQQRGDQFHLHPFAQRELAHHHVQLVGHVQQFRQAADDPVELSPLDPVDRPVQFQRLRAGRSHQSAFFCPISSANCRFISSLRSQGVNPEHGRLPARRIQQPGEHFQNRRFPRAVRPQEADEFPLLDAKAHPVRRPRLVILPRSPSPFTAPQSPGSLR